MQAKNKAGVSFFTCCYEADWEFFLKEGRLKEMIERCNHAFSSRNLIINNVNNKEELKRYAELAIQENVIDNYFFSEDYVQDVLKNFSLKRRDFKLDGFDGYWYSIAPLTAIYTCSTEYILYFMGDCMLNEKYAVDWVENGMKQLHNKNVFCVTPLWNYYNKEVENDLLANDSVYAYDQGFSDQCFLAETRKLNGNIYNEYNSSSERFPIYGGNHFERRIYCYINNRDYRRCVIKNIVYTHEKLLKPGFDSEKKFSLKDETKYIIARFKRIFRRRNMLIKFLLR
jgi:hypothetical protein